MYAGSTCYTHELTAYSGSRGGLAILQPTHSAIGPYAKRPGQRGLAVTQARQRDLAVAILVQLPVPITYVSLGCACARQD